MIQELATKRKDIMWYLLRGASRTAVTSKMERFVIIVNGFQPLTIITKRSILDVAAVLDPPLFLIKNHSAVVPAETSKDHGFYLSTFLKLLQFHDISQLFRDHHFTSLDDELFGNNEVSENIINDSEAAIESPDPEVDAEVDLHCTDNIGNF